MDSLLKRLDEASNEGDVDTVEQLHQQDPLLLHKVLTEVRDNPLHIAALKNHIDLTRYLLQLEPELANQLNKEGQSPLHLAAASGHLQVARILVEKVGNSICLRKSNHGYMPVQTAIVNRKHDVVGTLVESCRETLKVVTDKRETLLHLAVMANCLNCVICLIEQHVLNINEKDEDGNTCLHLAAAKRNRQVMKHLLEQEGIEINSRNEMGLTPLDVLILSSLGSPVDISLVDTIRSAGAKRSRELGDLESNTNSSVVVGTQLPPSNQMLSGENIDMTSENLSGDAQTLLIVATLVATITFQAITNPPGGFIQPPNDAFVSPFSESLNSTWIKSWVYTGLFPAGRPVLLFQLTLFFVLDSLALFSSVSVILWLLVAQAKTKIVMKFLVAIVWFAVFCTAFAFGSAFFAIYVPVDLGFDAQFGLGNFIEGTFVLQRVEWVLGFLFTIFTVFFFGGLWATFPVISFFWRKAGFNLLNWIAEVCCLKDGMWFKRIIATVRSLLDNTWFRKIIYGLLVLCVIGAFVVVTGGLFLSVFYNINT